MTELPKGFEPLIPAVQLFSALSVPWWLTGGWAIDLAVGSVSRPHNGIDLYMMSDDAAALSVQLDDATFEAGDRATVVAHQRDSPARERLFVVSPELPLRTQVAFGLRDGDDWVLPEDPTIRLPMADAVASTAGVPRLALAVILLLRAFSFRAQDQADFETALPLLDERERAWLIRAIEERSANAKSRDRSGTHPWLTSLRRG